MTVAGLTSPPQALADALTEAGRGELARRLDGKIQEGLDKVKDVTNEQIEKEKERITKEAADLYKQIRLVSQEIRKSKSKACSG